MITDVHVHHVPAGFLRFVQDAAPVPSTSMTRAEKGPTQGRDAEL
jgi:hypothetical protein